MKVDLHIKIEQSYILQLQELSKEEGLPFTRFIETAIREYLEHVGPKAKYRITAFNDTTGKREAISPIYLRGENILEKQQQYRELYQKIYDTHKRLQVERVTL